ncbi:hypothetical protein QE152_g27444 [Popillia japonica]|uniref:Uncharacterized protein n=1 Tax=Popillia japonica TaxID=7064 RepID=A0AAW1JW95_POPJA
MNQNGCRHSDEQRALVGTWVRNEVRKALEKGYRLLDIYEVWEYKVVNGLFKDYINEYLKIKQQSSGWPTGCDSAEEKERLKYQLLEVYCIKYLLKSSCNLPIEFQIYIHICLST